MRSACRRYRPDGPPVVAYAVVPGRRPLEERGVTIMGIRDGQIAWGCLYFEETERGGTPTSQRPYDAWLVGRTV